MNRMMSIDEVAEELGVSSATIYRRISQFRPVRVGSRWRIARVDLENWIRRNRECQHESSSAETSGSHGSPASEVGPARSRRTAPTRRPPRSGPPNSNVKHSIRPTQPRTVPRPLTLVKDS